jgi:hypothetical protein
MDSKRPVIDLMERKKEIMNKRINGRIRWFDGLYEYCIIDNYENRFGEYESHGVLIGGVYAILLVTDKRMVFASIQFPQERFTVESIIEWLDTHKIVFLDRGDTSSASQGCTDVIERVKFAGCSVILCKKDEDDCGPGRIVNIQESTGYTVNEEQFTYSGAEIPTVHCGGMAVVLDGEILEEIPVLEFDPSRDIIIVNGSVIAADCIDKYRHTMGFYNSEDKQKPVAFILDADTVVNIEIDVRDDGSRACIVEYGYDTGNDDL